MVWSRFEVKGGAEFTNESIRSRFSALTNFLKRNQILWLERPFHQPRPTWTQNYPALTQWLLDLSDIEVERLDQTPIGLCTRMTAFLPDLAELAALTRVPRSHPANHTHKTLPHGFEWGIPGRKWQQVTAFSHAVLSNLAEAPVTNTSGLPTEKPRQWLDWCAGKGHLSRLLSWITGERAQALERQAVLCEAGQALAQRFNVRQQFNKVDVLGGDLPVTPMSHVLALHACGPLHHRLIASATQLSFASLHLSPCCYQLLQSDQVLMSATGLNSGLKLMPQDLHLAVEENVTAGSRRTAIRKRELLWRFAFEQWRLHQGMTDSSHLPSVPAPLLRSNLQEFLRWAAQCQNISAPPSSFEAQLLDKAHRRRREFMRLSLLRHTFRRPLELWIVADRALALLEQGFAVGIEEFCDRAVSPRNLLIHAQHS